MEKGHKHDYNDRKEHFNLRFYLVAACLLSLLFFAMLGACTQMDNPLPDPGKEPGAEDGKCLVRFAPLQIDEGAITRATQVVGSGQLRLMVYQAGTNIFTQQPAADKLYNVKDGLLTVADGEQDLELSSGNYLFYALMPVEVTPALGITAKQYQHGDDVHACMTKVSVSEGAIITLEPLTHKASRVEFIIEKASDALFQTLGKPSQMTLFSQPLDPVTFKLDDTGGNFQVQAGTDTLLFDAFTAQVAPEKGYRQDRIVLPRPVGSFNIAIRTQIDLGDGQGMKECTVKGQITNRMFDPGRYYHFRIRVKDPREGGDIMLVVTEWNEMGWDSSMGGSGQEILVGRWNGITYGDDMGV